MGRGCRTECPVAEGCLMARNKLSDTCFLRGRLSVAETEIHSYYQFISFQCFKIT